ncbi:MAG: hypothetical protein LBU32_25255 [Clostridiales bacterium]|jgi:hypothetical protein|nr:hypothetical protein [Clostridiales bacterium]
MMPPAKGNGALEKAESLYYYIGESYRIDNWNGITTVIGRDWDNASIWKSEIAKLLRQKCITEEVNYQDFTGNGLNHGRNRYFVLSSKISNSIWKSPEDFFV